jgi:hypothetical protein
VACTPAGIEALLAHDAVQVAGREKVILGRGATLGRPLAMLLAQKRPTANAAVTVVHTGVADWPRYTRRAEILIAAARVPGIIQPEHVRPGAVVIGAGVRYAGRRQLPDVAEACADVAAAITPRVGGVGPTTVAMLFRNALTAADTRPHNPPVGSGVLTRQPAVPRAVHRAWYRFTGGEHRCAYAGHSRALVVPWPGLGRAHGGCECADGRQSPQARERNRAGRRPASCSASTPSTISEAMSRPAVGARVTPECITAM